MEWGRDRHLKMAGWVEHIAPDHWTARLEHDGVAYTAEMKKPLPGHARHGSLFTLHRTKAGKVYLYWITRPRFSKRQLKRARQRARGWAVLRQESR